jgi:hypothetical protein
MNVDWRSDEALPPFAPEGDFPQLAFVRDAARVGVVLQAGGHAPGITGPWVLENLWYLPHRSLWGIYAAPGEAGKTWIGSVRYRYPGEDDSHRGGADIPDLGGRLWVFPDDPALTGLANLVGAPGPLASVLPKARQPDGWSLLSYLPGTRCTVAHLASDGAPVAVGKLQKGTAATHRAMTQLWHDPGRRFVMAEPLAEDRDASIRWERHVPGVRLDRIADPGLRGVGVVAAMQALASLHRLSVDGLPTRDAPVVLDRLTRKAGKRVAAALPALAGRVTGLCDHLAQAIPPSAGEGLATLHGDFHTANILIDDGNAAFIDLDELARGDPPTMWRCSRRGCCSSGWSSRTGVTKWLASPRRFQVSIVTRAALRSRPVTSPGTSRPCWSGGR